MINGKELGEVGFKYLGVPYSEMDCQAFVEQCLKDCGCNKNLAGSNAWFREVLNNGVILTPEECVNRFGLVPLGAFLFILKQDGKEPEKYKSDGIGNASHIGICTWRIGEGAINSSSSKGCVCESKFVGKSIKGGWNRVGLWNYVDYSDSPIPIPIPETQIATVNSPNGGSVKMRQKPSTSCNVYWDVPNGSVVDVIERNDDWSNIKWDGKKGYMMSKFLIVDNDEGDISPIEMVSVPREELHKIYDAIGKLLGLEVG